MFTRDKLLPSVLIILFLIPSLVFSQNTSSDSFDNKLIGVAREIMASVRTCALITLDQTGRPRVRTMDPFPPDNNLVVWLGTNTKSRKVDQIKNDPRVTLYYLDNDNSGYVIIYGIAELVNPQDEKEERWKDEWAAFYPNKADDYLLIKVSPEWLEVISESRGIIGDSVTWKPPMVFFKTTENR